MALPCKALPKETDTVIVGNGPSALILAFILSGNIPYYNFSNPHPDPILRRKLSQSSSLLDVDVADLTSHFAASRLSYSTQALPINVLLDTLLRPLADTDPGEYVSCVEWRSEPSKYVPHVVLGNTSRPGGQWADDLVGGGSSNIGTLSYAEQLALPRYSFQEHFNRSNRKQLTDLYRPTRHEVSTYLAAYPEAVGIADSVFTNVNVQGICRSEDGFYIKSTNMRCKRLVLASGVFSDLIPPRPLLQPLIKALPVKPACDLPLLVIGSGFTAADVIISSPPNRRIIHIFKWNTESPSPLQACHPREYREYSSVYRQMKLSAKRRLGYDIPSSPMRHNKSNSFFDRRDWDNIYEGLPNTLITDVALSKNGALLTLEETGGRQFQREISAMAYVIGRRGSLGYLEKELAREVFSLKESMPANISEVSSGTLRHKIEGGVEVAQGVFAIGSLTGDSLIRFAFGGCAFAARDIMMRMRHDSPSPEPRELSIVTPEDFQCTITNDENLISHEHSDFTLDKKNHSVSVDLGMENCDLWRESGLRVGGCIII